MKKNVIITVSMFILIGIVIFLEFERKSIPIHRHNILTPIYSIGDKSYELALKENKTVVKFGPMFMGIYPGGLAFPNPEGARKFMIENNWDLQKWNIYQLSGDYRKDVKNGHINKSLLVLRKFQQTE